MTEPQPGTPGSENTPSGDGPPSVADRATPGAPPPGSNQPKPEGFQTAQDATGEPATVGSADPQRASVGPPRTDAPLSGSGQSGPPQRAGGAAPGGGPEGAFADDDATGAARTAGPAGGGPVTVPSPGDAAGVSVPSLQAAGGTSEDAAEVTGVRATGLAPPSKPDGEVDTRG